MALAYTAPTWQNGGGVGISASQLQALSDCMEGLVQGSDKAITDISISGQTITLTFADGSVETDTSSGLKGISSIAKTGTSGLVDTYTITYTDGSTSTFTVTNGTQGETGPQGPQGPQGIQGPAGADGADGQDGADGISPEITITTITGGHAVEITDAEHPSGQSFDVMDGANTVIPNPEGAPVGTLSSIGINGDKYNIQGGGTTIVQIPSVVGNSFTYDGTAQGAAITGLDNNHCTVVPGTGTTVTTVGDTTYVKATNVGSYSFSVELNDTSSMVWSDLTVADKTYSFTIAKASQTVTASKYSVSLDAQTLSDTVTISGANTTLNCQSSDTSVATVSESSGTLTISSVNNTTGTATITVYAESSSNYEASAAITISVEALFVITKSITVHSAANDTVSFTDRTGAKTVTTDSSGSGSVSITYMNDDIITFTSNVAKNPDNLSNAFTKSIQLKSNTTDIFVMPSGCIYWYGYKSSDFSECTDANGWVYQTGQSYTSGTPSYSTNYVTFNAGDRKYIGITCTSPLSNISTVYAIAQGVTPVSGYYGLFGGSTNKIIQDATSAAEGITSASITKLSKDVSSLSGAIYPFIEAQWGRNLKAYALWYE